MAALLDALKIDRVGVVAHDVGGAVVQPLARVVPERIAGLVLFGFSHPGIGPQGVTPDRLNVPFIGTLLKRTEDILSFRSGGKRARIN